MNHGELLTRLSIWLALVAAVVAAGFRWGVRGRVWEFSAARWAWTLGCGIFLLHIACAFSFYHEWSHAAAIHDTARQTAEMTGWRWGGGLYLNYAFAIAWLADVLWWWCAPASFARRPPRLRALWHAFFFFMILNGAVIFARPPMRWFGALLCALLLVFWWRQRPARRPPRGPPLFPRRKTDPENGDGRNHG